jgi:maltooligosyltrehalose synthase
VEGSARQHVFAFGRILGDRHVLVCVPRLVATLAREGHAPIGEVWGDTRISVPGLASRCYRQIFTGACATVVEQDGRKWVRAAEVFAQFPIAFLEAA